MEALGTILLPVIIGLVAVAKEGGFPSRFAPLLAVALGLFFAWLAQGWSFNTVIVGIILGLASSGLWSSAKALVGK